MMRRSFERPLAHVLENIYDPQLELVGDLKHLT